MKVRLSSVDTSAARGSSDSDMAADQAHLHVPIVIIDFRGVGCGWFDYDYWGFGGVCCCCC
jgi:hypothetical protein